MILLHITQFIYISIRESVTKDSKYRFSEESVDFYYLLILFLNSTTLKDNTLFKETVWKVVKKYSTFLKKLTDTLEKIIISELELWNVK